LVTTQRFSIVLKPSLAGEGGVRRNQKLLFFSILYSLYFKKQKNEEKRINSNISSPKPSPA
jgi:hypothetical protein